MKEFKDDDYLEAVRASMQHIIDRNPGMGELEVNSYNLERFMDMGFYRIVIRHIMDTLDYIEGTKTLKEVEDEINKV